MRKSNMKLSKGDQISHLDNACGGTELNIAKVIRARGKGVLVERDGLKYRINRDDVIRKVS